LLVRNKKQREKKKNTFFSLFLFRTQKKVVHLQALIINSDFLWMKHAQEQMRRRGINYETVLLTVSEPDQTIVDDEDMDIIICQSIIKEDKQMFMLRVFVNRDRQPNVVITLYKTTKISKYYESKV
jgi:hypothetical protein